MAPRRRVFIWKVIWSSVPHPWIEAFPGYKFGLHDEEVLPVRSTLTSLPVTDADGKATIVAAADRLPDSTRPLSARIAVRMREGGVAGQLNVRSVSRWNAPRH